MKSPIQETLYLHYGLHTSQHRYMQQTCIHKEKKVIFPSCPKCMTLKWPVKYSMFYMLIESSLLSTNIQKAPLRAKTGNTVVNKVECPLPRGWRDPPRCHQEVPFHP